LGEDGLALGRTRRATSIQHCDTERKEEEMSTTQTVIGEHDVVTLRNSVDGWPAGTEGTVVSVFPTHRWVEVGDGQGESLDIVSLPPDQLELIWKSP
jgi:hypothetical protein